LVSHKELRNGLEIIRSEHNGHSAGSRCVDCQDIITQPICSHCLHSQMKVMVGEFDPELASEIDPCEISGDTNCIQCGKEMGLCAHCYSKDVYLQIKSKNENIAAQFIARFDFDLRESMA
jgi:hypothetical protein